MTYKNTIKNNPNKKAIIVIIAGVVFLFTFTSLTGGQRTYQVKPEIEIPAYKTDNTRMIEAYERLMDRYMGLVEKNLGAIDQDIKNTSQSLASIEMKLDNLSTRMAKIEKALGIEETQSPITTLPGTQVKNTKEVTTEGK